MRVMDLLAQHSLNKVSCETKLIDMEDTNWKKMKEKPEGLIHIYVLDKLMYDIPDLTMSNEVSDKLEI